MSATKKLVVIVGATGTQGGNVVREFVKHPEYRLRAITRDASKESTKALAVSGVEVVQGDLNDLASLKSAFSGAFAVYGYTNFFDTHLTDDVAVQQAEAREIQQATNLAVACAETPSLEHYIWSSTPNAREQSDGKYQNIRFFNSKSHVTKIIKTKMPELWKKTTEIWIGFMYENIVKFRPFFGPAPTEDGAYELAVPLVPHSVLGSTSCADLGKFVHFLLQSGDKYHEKTIALVTEELTESSRLAIWGKAVNRRVQLRPITQEEYMARLEAMGIPHTAAQGFAELFGLFSDLGNAYSGPHVLQARDLLPKGTLQSWENFVDHWDWADFLKS